MSQKQALQLFNDRQIRTAWDENEEKWFFSIVDVVAVLTDSSDARNYWKVLKNRLKKEGNESVTKCNQLKLLSPDGKRYLTDEWKRSGVKDAQYASLTDIITQEWSGLTTKQYKQHKGLKKENLRDNMTRMKSALNTLAEGGRCF